MLLEIVLTKLFVMVTALPGRTIYIGAFRRTMLFDFVLTKLFVMNTVLQGRVIYKRF